MPAREFETGSLTLALMQSDAFGLTFEPHSHPIALHVEDVAAARKELEDQGIEFFGDIIDSGGCHMGHFKEPHRNALMFHHPHAPPEARPSGGQAGHHAGAPSSGGFRGGLRVTRGGTPLSSVVK